MLTQEQTSFYRDNGYLMVRGLLDREEAKALREECHDLARRLTSGEAADSTWSSARGLVGAGESTALTHCPDVQFHAAAFGRLLVGERFTSAAAAVLGGPNVQLHHTKMFIKPPEKGSPFPLHQDHPFFPHTRHTVAAAIFHFDDAPVERGCVRVVPGSHLQGPLPHDAAEGDYHLPFEQYPLELSIPCAAQAGDVLFFSYLTVHGSGINASDEARTTLLVQFRDPEDLPVTATHRSRGQGVMLRGIDPSGARSS